MRTIVCTPAELQDIVSKAIAAELSTFKPKADPVVKPEYLTRRQAADLLSVSLTTLDSWAASGRIKRHRIAGGAVRYRRSELVSSPSRYERI